MPDQISEAVKYVKHLVKNRGKPYPVAIDQAAKEFRLSTKQISNALRPPKKAIKWIKPNFSEEVGEYFENQQTKSYLFNKGYEFSNDKELIDFLSKGKMKELSKIELARTENLTTNPSDFEEELKEEGYSDSYNSMRDKLNKDIKISLPAPILLKTENRYYGFSGNRRMNLAWNNNLPVKFWVVDAPDIAPKQQGFKFISSDEAIQYLANITGMRIFVAVSAVEEATRKFRQNAHMMTPQAKK